MNLKQWCQIDEAIHVAATDEEYKKYAGIDNDEKLIERLAESWHNIQYLWKYCL